MKGEDENEQQLVLTINEPIDAETEYSSIVKGFERFDVI